MKIVLQRVSRASVLVDGQTVGAIGRGICLLVGVERGDREEDADYLATKIAELRIFPDADKKMNLSLKDINGELLAVSQFTLAGSVRKGRRPSFDGAEDPDRAVRIFEYFVERLRILGIKRVETGVFAALMEVRIDNDGPVTFVLERGEGKG
jgi:D-tyrosyl-tRNA(Tyr) deacylase